MAADLSGLLAVGLSHHTAPVDVRERMALPPGGVQEELATMRRRGLVREALLLSTCNRVEIYAVPEPRSEDAFRSHVAQQRAGGRTLEPYLYWHRGDAAVRHLFRVASSLDSLVVGEPQILGQVKAAVRLAEASGSLGAVLNRLAQRSLWVAKQVRTHTDIGRYNVGIGNAGVHLAQQIFHDLDGRRALLVGVGEMGRQVARAMVSTGLEELLVANRTFDKAIEVAEEFGGTPLRFDRVAEYLERVDIVITATGAVQPILRKADVAAALKARRHKPLFLVDLAVPRNIDPAVDELDHAFLFNVDDLVKVTEKGIAARAAATADAEALVDREAARFSRRLADLAVNTAIGDLVKHVDGLREAELARTAKVLERLDPADRATLEAMMRAFQKKVLHQPLGAIRTAARGDDAAQLEAVLGAWGIALPDDPGDEG